MVTQEPRGLNFINNINTNSFSSLTSQVCWLVGSIMLTIADYQLLREDTELERQAGIFLAGILVTAWTGKTVAGVFDSNNKRKAHPAYAAVLEAEERGKVTGAASAVALADVAANKQMTRENAAKAPPVPPTTSEHQVPQNQVNVNLGDESADVRPRE